VPTRSSGERGRRAAWYKTRAADRSSTATPPRRATSTDTEQCLLRTTGRDVEERELGLRFDKGRFVLDGEGPAATLSPRAIRAGFAGASVVIENATRGVLVTTSSFTAPAVKSARKAGLTLYDLAALRRWIREVHDAGRW